ncbi:GntR family transcriptional regulator [Pseudoduganella umbonata]|uniref:GntR family transcriptional regulator n=1 Tax=Pseudoduganella umbonata TaxID=864828 RepID=A0A4P8HKG8_9BURK|nr:GntR family transcriptional regulator [Pseudoduganella umbonata]MBB3221035.1 DNA-binding GntR family transcriptional regulator [Pseudoduganella umbonata]QCP10239.1 GntR family transcriptional regulator [Pseudoduganella umbonata]
MIPGLPSTPFRLDRLRNASSQVFDHLRGLIVTLVLAPGTQLHRSELADYYGLSSTPLRDALSRLGEEGLVDIVPQQTTTVSRIDVDAARQAHLLRLSLELEVVNSLAQAPDAALALALQQSIAQQRLAAQLQDDAAFDRASTAFHRQLFKHAQVADLWELLLRQGGNLERLQRLQPRTGAQHVLADHAGIADAIGRGDGGLAMDRVRQCLGDALAGVAAIRAKYPEYLGTGDSR